MADVHLFCTPEGYVIEENGNVYDFSYSERGRKTEQHTGYLYLARML